MAIEPLDSVTRICLARELSAATWLRLFKEAYPEEASGKHASEASTNAVYLRAIDLLLPLLRKSGTPLTQTYLQACLVADEPKRYLLKTLLVGELVGAVTASSIGIEDSLFLECIAATLLASDPALVSMYQPHKTSIQALGELKTSIRLLAIAAQYQSSSLFLLMLQLLQVPQPATNSSKNVETHEAIGSEISSCREVLLSMTSAAVVIPYPFELAHRLLNDLERKYNPVSYRRSTLVRPATYPSMPLKIELLLQSALYNQCEGISAALAGSIMARLALRRAISSTDEAASHQEVLRQWLADLIEFCSRHTSIRDEADSRSEARWRAFVFGRLPTLIRSLKDDPHLSPAGLDWSLAIDLGLQDHQDRQTQSGSRDQPEWVSSLKAGLSVPEKQVLQPSEYSAEALIGILEDGLHDYDKQASASSAMATQLSTWAAASDLPSIHQLLLSLVKETPRIMDYVLLHSSAESLFKATCLILDNWDSSEEYGAGQAMELYGGIFLALRTLVHRHSLQQPFSMFNLSVSSAIIAPSRSLAKAQSLKAPSLQHQKIVSSWITALYGSEGIEDDLIRSTPPQTMLLLAPTIVHQSVTAMENALLNGLSYFCQDFLTFTLPGIISYLADRTEPNLQIITPLLMSESTPACVFELVQDELREMLKKLDPADESVKTLQRKVKNGPIAVPLDQDQLGSSGLSAVQHIAASTQGTPGDNRVVSIALQAQDAFTGSFLAAQAMTPLSKLTIKAFALEAMNRANDLESEEVRIQQIDRLADIVALILIRAGHEVRTEDYSSFPTGFRERLRTWSSET